ncbi:MAG: exopolysaccharide biosynthesis polyprenyl glycosylphosphotransferase [Oscillospiraceae bacterium]
MSKNSYHYKKDFIVFLLKALNIVAVTFLFLCAWYVLYAHKIAYPFFQKGNYFVVFIFAVLYSAFSKLYGGYKLGVLRVSELMYSHCIAIVVCNVLMYAVIVLLARGLLNPLGMVWAAICQMLWCCIWAMWANRFFFCLHSPQNALLIYENADFPSVIKNLNKARFTVNGIISVENGLQAVYEAVDKADCVFLCGVSTDCRNEIIKYCIQSKKSAYVRPHISDIIISGAKRLNFSDVPILLCESASPPAWYLVVKRGFDVIACALALVVLSPFMLLTAIFIKLSDGGPVLFTQLRMTKDRKIFKIYKFRSMKVDADKGGKGIVTMENDDRITPIGKFIRICRIDEIPQLINILKGDMTIVGPRPERLETIALYEQETPEFALRLQVTAGLTGYAQIYGKANTSPYDKLQMDLMYIANMSVIEDAKIILTTLKVLFMPESTQGFEKSVDETQEQESI